MQRLLRQAVALAAVGLLFALAAGTSQAATPAPRLLAMYQPVLHFDPLEKFRPASVVHRRRVAQDGDHTVLQYWLFYYDDVYSYAYPPSNFIWQAHEGDWEVVNVVLDENEHPISSAYSQHCLGQTRGWANTPKVGDTHPVVYVALGSHANYFTVGTHPINPVCVPPAALAILNGMGLPPPADHVLEGPVIGPAGVDGPATPVHMIGDDTPWVSFDGYWGELQYFHAPAPINTVPFGTSPIGPAQHQVWIHPLATIGTWASS